MAESRLHAVTEPQSSPRREAGPITSGLLKWSSNGPRGPYPFGGGSNGPEVASGILLKVHALTTCLSAAFSDSANGECEFGAVVDSEKALAMDALGDLIMLAKILVNEE